MAGAGAASTGVVRPSNADYEKIVIFGAGGVGKSSITLRFVTNRFTSEYEPTIEDSYRKQFTLDGEPFFLDILDTAGQEEYTALRDQWCREGAGFVLVFSVTSRESFDEIGAFRERILEVTEDDEVPMVLVGNKIDLGDQRDVTHAEGRALADRFGMSYIETSALEGTNCDSVFYTSARRIRQSLGRRGRGGAGGGTGRKRRWFCTLL